MSRCFLIKWSDVAGPQADSDQTFIGGLPKLPASEPTPTCRLCGAELTFFFQIAFPSHHEWTGLTLAVFACTSCSDEGRLIPEMLLGPLGVVHIPEGFLESYQTNFRFLVFRTNGWLRRDYAERIRFARLVLQPSDHPDVDGDKVGGTPNWLLDDESPPRPYEEHSTVFLLQLEQGARFETIEGAPPQIVLGLDGTPEPSNATYYELFLGNAIYLFGTKGPDGPLVYAITQVD